MKSFTLIELLVIIAILVVLTGMAVPALRFFGRESDLNNSAEEIINTLRLAQNKTIASEGASSWGVYFSTSTTPHQYTLFKGINYASRAASSDETHQLPKIIIVSEIGLGGEREIVFARLTGAANQSGSLSLESKTDPPEIRTIYIESSGRAGLTNPLIPSDENRIKDSRHVHFDYSGRNIATSTESLILTFDGGAVTETIIIGDNIRDGQIFWEREIDVGGQTQRLKIHTHRFNNPDTQFSIHRDRRYNNKTLTIDIDDSPDPDPGTLIEYSADGLTTIKTSDYATDPQWQ